MALDFKQIVEKAESYRPQISAFLRDMIAIPSESCEEEKVILRIRQEMEAVGFDRVEVDPMGNVLGYIGHGKHLIAMDAHIDTVGIGNRDNWTHDPYEATKTMRSSTVVVPAIRKGDGINGLCR